MSEPFKVARYILVPIDKEGQPPFECLNEMYRATFLNDGSLLEYQRRWNGFLHGLRQYADKHPRKRLNLPKE